MRKIYWLYGGLMGGLFLVLQAMNYKAMVRDIQFEVFGGLVALLFLVVGVWLGVQFVRQKESEKVSQEQGEVHQLSERELEVLGLLAEGLSNKEIADRLFVSLNTAKTHISNIYQKLNVSRRTQAVQKARELAIITSPESTIR